MDCITGFGLGEATGIKEITAYQPARWDFGNFFVPFGFSKMIVVDADGLFSGMFKNTFQEKFIIPVHEVARGNHKAITNEKFHRYLNKVHKKNSVYRGSLHQYPQSVLFALYAWNAGPVYGTDIDRSLVAIGRELPFPIDLSPSRLREGTSEGQ